MANGIFYEVENFNKSYVKIYKKIRKELKKYSIIVLRVDAKGRLVESKPCVDCTKYLKTIGIKSVFYSNAAGDIIFEKVKNLQTTHLCRAKRAKK